MISGWGNYPRVDARIVRLHEPAEARKFLGSGRVIARGAGRAYGDSAVGTELTLETTPLNRMLEFDVERRELTAEAGVTLSDIIRVFLPRGFFPEVVPGTQFVTVGGMVASHVHGKNHHGAGGFGRYVNRLKLATADGAVVVCSPHENAELFRATIGGMGLTGVILEATFRLKAVETSFIRQELIVAENLDSAMKTFEASSAWTYTVGWIDGLAKGNSLGRSLIYRGEHARAAELGDRPAHPPAPEAGSGLQVPLNLPNWSLNRLTVGAFNEIYYRNGSRKQGSHLVSWQPYFFPLDSIRNWNRIYGNRGFIQHQCVLPKAKSRDGIGAILERIADHGNPSFLAVLKLMGSDDVGMMGFPMEGYTLAIDFPASPRTFKLADELDEIVISHGGRLYLAKDARQKPRVLEAGYPALNRFRTLRRETGAFERFQSRQSERLEL